MASGRLAIGATATFLSTLAAFGGVGATACTASKGEAAPAAPAASTAHVADGDPAPRHDARRSGRIGAPGIGDPDFPTDGNGGYDVEHYGLRIGYDPPSRRLEGVTTITAKATQDLDAFNLDLSGFRVARVTVDGRAATFTRAGTELTVTPATPLPASGRFTVVVSYDGEPKPITGSSNLGTYGFIPTRDGAFVTSEPNGAKTWFPGNDHPADKAGYDFEVTVPAGLTVLANGEMVGAPVTSGGRTTFRWRESHPMATYLATITLGRFELRQGTTASGIANLAAVDPRYRDSLGRLYSQSGRITDYWSTVFGPYPFSSTGGVIDDFSAGYALENQTKPMYGGFVPDDDTVAHELAHQWFGDSLSIRRWKDLWLNEGFATYAEWLWKEHNGVPAERSFRATYDAHPAGDAIWKYPPGRAQPQDLFNDSVYRRGGMALHALRRSIGDAAFFKVLRTWTAEHRYGYVTTEEFVALAERISGRQLDALFDAWLFKPVRPAA